MKLKYFSLLQSISRKRIETIMLNILDCKTMEGYVEVDLKTILGHKVPKRYIDKCLAACLAEIGLVVSSFLKCTFKYISLIDFVKTKR